MIKQLVTLLCLISFMTQALAAVDVPCAMAVAKDVAAKDVAKDVSITPERSDGMQGHIERQHEMAMAMADGDSAAPPMGSVRHDPASGEPSVHLTSQQLEQQLHSGHSSAISGDCCGTDRCQTKGCVLLQHLLPTSGSSFSIGYVSQPYSDYHFVGSFHVPASLFRPPISR